MSTIEATNNIEKLLQWKGRSQTSVEMVSAEWCRRVGHTLDRVDVLGAGDVLPPLWHFTMHLDSVPLRGVGQDGHPERGGFLPPVALPRRMWAGSRISFVDDVLVGDTVAKTSTVENIVMKQGRTGLLCFVTVRHELSVVGDVRIIEEQDLVYRDDADPDAPKPPGKQAPEAPDWSEIIEPSEVMLFRYSAMTFNGHRIHYDREYARNVEGYEGLVVHGPLTATLLADLSVGATGRRLASFSFRGVSPLFDTAPFTIAGSATEGGATMWAESPTGQVAMQAEAVYR